MRRLFFTAENSQRDDGYLARDLLHKGSYRIY